MKRHPLIARLIVALCADILDSCAQTHTYPRWNVNWNTSLNEVGKDEMEIGAHDLAHAAYTAATWG